MRMGVWLNKDDYIRDLKRISLFLLIVYMAVLVGTDQDFYSLLGVSKTASSREIRQAFKKLALKLHPDKNPNNPNAHGDFLKINRAYEVLKDEDLRKKYDKYGEKGLEDNQGGQYESWNYYRYDFGIYDDDPEIITLERREFDAAVNSGEVWFVNFYSSGCSHCHDLAPTWRDFAKEVDGLLRIGAVNCGDDRMLCRMKGVNSYPSLLIFRSGMAAVKYYGDRSKESLVSFAMQHIRSTVSELSTGNFVNSIQTAFAAGIGWLITFCSKGGDCLTSQTRLRLSGMLDGLVNVGWMDCATQDNLCKSLDITTSTTAYFPPGATLNSKEKNSILFLNSLDAKEIYLEIIRNLPDFELLSASTLEDRLAHHRWLLFFYFGKNENSDDPELKKLKTLLKNDHIQVGRFDCSSAPDICSNLYVFQPCLAVFKGQGTKEYEIHHGKYNIQAYPTTVVFNQSSIHEYEGHHSAKQILEFIEDLRNPSVITLTPSTFSELVKQRKHDEVWMVDFYSPWCHPCQVLMPEWKRMARTLTGLINVGSVDCQQYHSFCAQENVQRYPEIRFFPKKSNKDYQYHSYNGWNRDAYSLRIWALGFLPQVSIDLTPQTFSEKVLQGKNHWVVDFYAPWCGPCQNFAPEFELLARMVKGKVKAGKVDCQAYAQTCQKAGIKAYPTVKFYSYERTKKNIWEEQVNARDAKTIAAFIHGKLETLQNQGKRNKDEL
ncbi:dnaJ homolog subfamily C member 10 [Marmota marmota marmota]|uniref:dnaJ homolog subfamily C member 10 n=1 Tax=Marmota marmota marmota TaxID=9994 RepID=UPI002092C04F|nr:dnaJ homolog subfamily C member 10 [Marmota marmota marmota]